MCCFCLGAARTGRIGKVRFFRYRWNEAPVDHRDRGPSTWYFRVDEEGTVVSQWEVYDSGVVLHYDRDHLLDEYGMLADQPFDVAEALAADARELDRSEYETATAALVRRPPT